MRRSVRQNNIYTQRTHMQVQTIQRHNTSQS